jgi:glycosyltransferase involved in cell wall biosynthesis
MDKPLISVLIPCYNREKYIGQCVTSVIDQSYRNLEIIICDNSSTDQTYTILKGLAAKDSRIHLLRNERNIGPVPNWRKCLEQARGEYIHWMWSDDYIEPGFYGELLQNMMQMSASVGLANFKVFRQSTGNCVQGKYFSYFTANDGKSVAKGLLARRPLWAVSPAAWLLPAHLVRKHFYDKIPQYNGYNCNTTAIGADLLMIAGCCMEVQKVIFCQDTCAVFRVHPESISISRPTWRHYEAAKIWFLLATRLQQGCVSKCWLTLRALRIRSLRLTAHCLFQLPTKMGLQNART